MTYTLDAVLLLGDPKREQVFNFDCYKHVKFGSQAKANLKKALCFIPLAMPIVYGNYIFSYCLKP